MSDEDELAAAIGHVQHIPEHMRPFAEFLREFNNETPRGAALTAAALLDDLLQQAIAAFLVPNESAEKVIKGFNAPLGTLSARIAACHALGILSDAEFAECDLVRKIRNEFAHKVKMSFADDRVRSLCANMMMRAKPPPDEMNEPRTQFTTAAVALLIRLTNRAHYVRQKALKHHDWRY